MSTKRTFTKEPGRGGVKHGILLGGKVPIKLWTEGVYVESEARQQLLDVASMPFVFKHVSVMPDVHKGIGGTVGSVIATTGAIMPATVGVDIGCVDKDTEYLTPIGWKKISDYIEGDRILQFDPVTNVASFELPTAFIKLPCKEFFHLKSRYGINQALSAEHKVLYYKAGRKRNFSAYDTITAEELYKEHNSRVLGFGGRFKTSFDVTLRTPGIGLTIPQIRVMVMVIADGTFPNPNTNNCALHFKKQRKVDRALELLSKANISYSYNYNEKSKSYEIRFTSPLHQKEFSGDWWKCTDVQLSSVVEEVFHWDGNLKDKVFFARNKNSADFIQYAMMCCGYRAKLLVDVREYGFDYRVFANTSTMVGIKSFPKTPIQMIPSIDGFKYCFTMPSGFWVMRRGGDICTTGNCGMQAVRTSMTASQLPDNLKPIRTAIEKAVPHGRTNDGGKGDRGAWGEPPEYIQETWHRLALGYKEITDKHPKVRAFNDIGHLGTLGTGNHFIEICLDESDDVWIMLHSGSRGVGNRIGSYFIDLAKKKMKEWFIELPNRDLAYLPRNTPEFEDYWKALSWAQNYALFNRELMMGAVRGAIESSMPGIKIESNELVDCHHNYCAIENHYGSNVLVTRKGAVRARKGDLGIIPGSMGARSFIVEGLGNTDSFNSCSHGAGRKMSRTEARKKFTIEQHKRAVQGIECRTDEEVIDETPGAYKDIDAVMKAQDNLVTVRHTLRQVVCVKG